MIRSRRYEPSASKADLLRSTEQQKLTEKRLLRIKRFLSVFTRLKHSQGHLRHKEYLYFLTLLQMPLHYIVSLFDLVLRYGAALVLGVYVVLLVEIGLPIFMLFAFMGSYCRKGYIRYWQCVPLLKGAGYTIALMTITPEFINTTSAGLSLLYITDMFSVKIPWSDCTFERVTNTCIPMNYDDENGSLHLNSRATFSALNYFRFNKQNQYPNEYYEKLGPVKKDWAISVVITWILIFMFMVQGFRNFQKIMSTLQLIAVLCWVLIFLCTLYRRGRYHGRSALYYGISPAFNVEFWLHIFMHVCDRDEPGSVILLSSLGLKVSTPDVDALIIYSFKLLFFTLLIFWVPILLQNVLGHYKISDSMGISGFEIIFAVIPDVLSRIALPQLWIFLWFLCIYIHSFASVLYTFTGAVDALTDAFPILMIYRIHMCALLCITSACINMLFVTRLSMVLINSWSQYGMVVLRMIVLAMVTFALTFIYSITRLANDYHFAYGDPPAKFWVQSWKITPFLVLFETVFMLYHHGHEKNLQNTTATLVLMSYVTAIVMLLPIFTVMLWKYCKHVKYHMVASVVRPERGWGYYIVPQRLARKHFHPEREVRYKINKLKCRHQCLISSRKFKRLQQTHIIRKNAVLIDMIGEP